MSRARIVSAPAGVEGSTQLRQRPLISPRKERDVREKLVLRTDL